MCWSQKERYARICDVISINRYTKLRHFIHATGSLQKDKSSYKTDANSGVVITRWYDNKCVNIWSAYGNPNDVHEVKRLDRSKKESIIIKCPEVVRNYNKSMGGVNLCDMVISLYRTNIKTKRWYIKILFHCGGISKVNAWNLYRRHCAQLRKPKKLQLTLLQFRIEIAGGFTRAGHPVRITGRPSKPQSIEPTTPTKRKNSYTCQ